MVLEKIIKVANTPITKKSLRNFAIGGMIATSLFLNGCNGGSEKKTDEVNNNGSQIEQPAENGGNVTPNTGDSGEEQPVDNGGSVTPDTGDDGMNQPDNGGGIVVEKKLTSSEKIDFLEEKFNIVAENVTLDNLLVPIVGQSPITDSRFAFTDSSNSQRKTAKGSLSLTDLGANLYGVAKLMDLNDYETESALKDKVEELLNLGSKPVFMSNNADLGDYVQGSTDGINKESLIYSPGIDFDVSGTITYKDKDKNVVEHIVSDLELNLTEDKNDFNVKRISFNDLPKQVSLFTLQEPGEYGVTISSCNENGCSNQTYELNVIKKSIDQPPVIGDDAIQFVTLDGSPAAEFMGMPYDHNGDIFIQVDKSKLSDDNTDSNNLLISTYQIGQDGSRTSVDSNNPIDVSDLGGLELKTAVEVIDKGGNKTVRVFSTGIHENSAYFQVGNVEFKNHSGLDYENKDLTYNVPEFDDLEGTPANVEFGYFNGGSWYVMDRFSFEQVKDNDEYVVNSNELPMGNSEIRCRVNEIGPGGKSSQFVSMGTYNKTQYVPPVDPNQGNDTGGTPDNGGTPNNGGVIDIGDDLINGF